MEAADQRQDFDVWLEKQLRLRRMTQTALAEALAVTPAAVSAWITGRAEPREDRKRAIAAALGVDEETVLRRAAEVLPRSALNWHHRPAHRDGGREFGNAAAFAFDADLAVLAREATQNSLDEQLDPQRPVRSGTPSTNCRASTCAYFSMHSSGTGYGRTSRPPPRTGTRSEESSRKGFARWPSPTPCCSCAWTTTTAPA